ncbi:MAG: AAA family ATPase [Clostridia bacterium]|nr:AAA family ATPase [Clostridia bacterium]
MKKKLIIIIIGPHAVGKMTVGQELAKITDLRLFHNHMSIELSLKLFDFGTPGYRALNETVRKTVFEQFATGDLPGLIFTYMMDFDDPQEFAYLQGIIDLFREHGADCHVVELCADFDVRIERNKSENRLANKESKRDLEWSEREMRHTSETHRLNSREGEILPFESYIKIDNTNLTPDEVAKIIKECLKIDG